MIFLMPFFLMVIPVILVLMLVSVCIASIVDYFFKTNCTEKVIDFWIF